MWLIFLLAADAPPQQPETGGPWWIGMAPIAAMLVLFYFLLLRPQGKQEKQRKQMVANLKKNDRIVNSGGIIGVVDSVKDQEDEVVLKGGLRITKSSVVRVVPQDESARDQK
jgi:preprotein translocase subunit YajC